jgi:hypothetical protein
MAQGQAADPAHRNEGFRNFPLTKFYDTPDHLPSGKPGELIRATEFDGYNLPLGVSGVRLLYHSRSANNDDVAVSGVALFPDEPVLLRSPLISHRGLYRCPTLPKATWRTIGHEQKSSRMPRLRPF